MRRDIQGVVLALVGATVLRLSVTDMMLAYVKPVMRPFLVASGVVLVVLGVLSVIIDARESNREHGAPRAAWLLVVPVFLVFVVAPPALGAFTADRAPTALPGKGEWTMNPLPDGDPVELALVDYGYRATWDGGGTLQGRTVELTGFVTPADPSETGGDGGWYLNRLQLSCCAADARVTRVLVSGAEQPAPDAWATVVGTYAPPLDADSTEPIPVIEAKQVTVVPEPKVAYEE